MKMQASENLIARRPQLERKATLGADMRYSSMAVGLGNNADCRESGLSSTLLAGPARRAVSEPVHPIQLQSDGVA
jgi:hypothetical protein